jgi:hypothetical protein
MTGSRGWDPGRVALGDASGTAQQDAANLIVEDGWVYFLHGWTQVIAEVLHVEIGPEKTDRPGRIAAEVRRLRRANRPHVRYDTNPRVGTYGAPADRYLPVMENPMRIWPKAGGSPGR